MGGLQAVEGGCHCGKVRYRAQADLDQVMTCNCSHCSKKGFLLTFVPAAQFELLSGEDALTEYRFNRRRIAHLFCATCGVESFARGEKDGAPMAALNVRCFDGVDPNSLRPRQVDGRSF